MGEQVAGAAGYGWLDGVRADLEREGYASRGVDIPACSVDAPHIRQRLYWVAQSMAHANVPQRERSGVSSGVYPQHNQPDSGSAHSHMADADQGGRRRRSRDGDCERNGQAGGRVEDHGVAAGCGEDRGDVADALCIGRPGPGPLGEPSNSAARRDGQASDAVDAGAGFWSDHEWILGADGKARRAQSGLPLLANGVPARVGRLRAYGNAIVPPLAAEVVKALMETLDD